MYCYQCEQTAKGTGCTNGGVCGKDPESAVLMDLLINACKGISMYASRARTLGATDDGIDVFIAKALFSTVTNVNFDPARLRELIAEAAVQLGKAKALYSDACSKAGKQPETLAGPAAWEPAADAAGLVAQGEGVSVSGRKTALGDDAAGLQELITYGLKGVAAYAWHAHVLGKRDPRVFAFFEEALDFLTVENPTIDQLLSVALKCGEINLYVMELLDSANTETFGHPEPTKVLTSPVKGKAILVSGHDLEDLYELLKQTEGKGVNIYTHGEMLPAHGYPKLKAFKHLVGNYGSAWQNQRREFDEFPGAILMTTNCIQRPADTYKPRIFTCGPVAFPGVDHIAGTDFAKVIDAALAAPGFTEDAPEKSVTTGFARNAVMSVAGVVIDAVKAGAVKHFFLIGGCDGAKPGRSYYEDFALAVPKDCVILTLACGKYRFINHDFGDIGGIPRLLDVGQCNDAYSAIQIAVALSQAFDCGVNDLPLSFILSWYEQKAVAILLTLLHLGIKNMKLGPSLPAFLTPAAIGVLVEKFSIAPISTVEADLKACLGN